MVGFVANTNEAVITSEQFERKAAGFWIRFFAYLVDLTLVNAVLVSLIVKNIIVVAKLEHFSIFYISFYSIVSGLVFYAYFILMTKYFGQTLGKMIFGLRVVADSGQPLNWTTVLFREGIGRFISVMTKVLYIIIPFTKNHKAVHDFIADTHVVHEKSYWKKAERVPLLKSTAVHEISEEKQEK